MAAAAPTVFILGNPQKAQVVAVFDDFRRFVASRCRLAGAKLSTDGRLAVAAGAERIIVLGGDGTMLGVGRSLGRDQLPLIGVNFGKLGFLAEFSIDELQQQFDRAVSDPDLARERMCIEAAIWHDGAMGASYLSLNDCVVQAGPAYRMIELAVFVSGQHLTTIAGDGLVLCTPTGSTAHNLSAGGPIVQTGVEALVLTPLNPHSLTHRPLVVESDCVIEIVAKQVNAGTTAIIDGQVLCPLASGDRIRIERCPVNFRVVHNPLYPPWHKLISKLRWGQPPTYQ